LKTIIRYWTIPVGLIIAAILLLAVISIFPPAQTNGKKVEFILSKNETAHSAALRLKESGIIDNPTKFVIMAKLLNYERKLKKGKYDLPAASDEFSILRILSKGGQASALVTIPEGKTLEQIADILVEHDICSKRDFLTQAEDKTFLAELGIPTRTAEGYLFPDSYEFEIQSEPKEILTRMTKRFFEIYDALRSEHPMINRLEGKTKNTLSDQEIIILASIVEGEAQLAAERPIIASVFLNRLKRRLPLQSCATIEYLLKERKPRLSLHDLSIESPYNTYRHLGLPPGPICNPGRNSLSAVLAPAKTDYLFFVSRGDGSHQFSKTGREHQAAIRRYQNTSNN
jgi:peptidoglycan lytic transglycosylase G